MSDLNAAAEIAQQYAEKHRHIVDLADALTKLGSLEQQTKDVTAANEKARETLADTKLHLAEAQEELLHTRSMTQATLDEAKARADAVIREAQAAAKQIRDKAAADASNTITNAQSQTNETLARLQEQVKEHNELLANTREQLGEAQAELAATQHQHDELDDRIQKLRIAAQNIALV